MRCAMPVSSWSWPLPELTPGSRGFVSRHARAVHVLQSGLVLLYGCNMSPCEGQADWRGGRCGLCARLTVPLYACCVLRGLCIVILSKFLLIAASTASLPHPLFPTTAQPPLRDVPARRPCLSQGLV